MTVSLDKGREKKTTTSASDAEKSAYIRGDKGVGLKQGGGYGVADNLEIDS